jgi:hypothetical protein
MKGQRNELNNDRHTFKEGNYIIVLLCEHEEFIVTAYLQKE